jgi:phospholipid/cholesterol/gamma-HCH transport system substrate-binding protein
MKKKLAIETSVGIFVLIGLVCVAYLTIKLGKMEWLGGDYYYLTAWFSSVSGLKDGAVVDMAGVQIGKIDRIVLNKEKLCADVRLKILRGVPISEDAIASVKTSGLIGDKYVKIEPGGSEVLLKDGERIIETESAVDIEEIVSKYAFGDVGGSKDEKE